MANIHERGNFDMTEILRKSQEQQKAREAAKQKASSTNKQSVAVQKSTDIASAQHGDYVETADGTGGILIDHEAEIEKMRENDKTGKALMQLVKYDGLISEANAYRPEYGENAPEGYDPGVEWIKQNPWDPKTKELKKIKEGFAGLSYGIEGLVPIDSEEAHRVAEAMEKVRTGEIVLPTPEEYEMQRQAAKERKRQRREKYSHNNNKSPKKQETVVNPKERNSIPIEEENPEPQMAEMPENAYITKGVMEQMDEMNNSTPKRTVNVSVKQPEQQVVAPQNINNAVDNDVIAQQIMNDPSLDVELPMEDDQEVGGIEIEQNAQQPKQPIDLFQVQENLDEASNDEVSEDGNQNNTSDTASESNVMVINVPKDEVDNFVKQMPVETFNKMTSADVIQINEVELKDVPTATRRIDSIAEYRAIRNRRKDKNKPTQLRERALPNSGYVATVKPATSMEMSTMFKSPTLNSDIEYQKLYDFCYTHMVDSSIGRMSFAEFVNNTDPAELEDLAYDIYAMSETSERKISIHCGEGDGGCDQFFEITVDANTIPDISGLSDEYKNRVKEIIEVRNDLNSAKELQKNSPIMKYKVVRFGDSYFYVRKTTGPMMTSRDDRLVEIGEKHGQFVALLILFVDKVVVTYQEREDVEPRTVEFTDVEMICEELKSLDDDQLDTLKDIIGNNIEDFPKMTYSLKGDFVCPNCGKRRTRIPCSVTDLIFQKVQRMFG
mgnify:CR=1 FL=1